MRILYKNRKGASVFNKILNKETRNDHSMKVKWQGELNIMINDDLWKTYFIHVSKLCVITYQYGFKLNYYIEYWVLEVIYISFTLVTVINVSTVVKLKQLYTCLCNAGQSKIFGNF